MAFDKRIPVACMVAVLTGQAALAEHDSDAEALERLEVRGSRIRVDGMDLVSACGNHMNPPLSYISPSSVEGVRVYTGIVPVSVGGDSIGGAIQVEAAAPRFAPGADTVFEGEAGAFYRTNGNARGANVALTVASEHLSLGYRGSTEKADNYRAGGVFKPAGPAAAGRGYLAGDEVGSTRYESTNQSLSLALHHADHLLQLTLGVQDIPYQGWPNQRMDMTRNDSDQLNLRYEGQYGWGALEARIYHENTRHGMQFHDDKLFWYGPNNVPGSDGIPCTPSGGPNGCAAGMPMDTEGRNDGAAVKADIELGARDLLRLGFEGQQYTLDDWWEPSGKAMWPNTFYNINNGRRDRLGAFAEWEAAWNERWTTQLGVRHETVEMNADEVQGYSPMYDPLSEAAFNAADRAKTDHNLDLSLLARATPSATSSYELGISRKTRSPNLYERYSWSTHGMSMRMINMAGDGNGYVGNLELEPEVAHTASVTADWHDADQARWQVKFTSYYTEVDDYIDVERCSGAPSGVCVPSNLAAAEAFVYLRFVNQRARLYGADLSGRLALADSPAYGVFSFTGVIGWLEGENVFDRFYFDPLGGAYTGQGKTMSGTDVPWGIPVPGMGRSVYTGVNVKF